MANWKCGECGHTKDSRCKPKKCPQCGSSKGFAKAEEACETSE
ncbi:hypothetical protein BAC1_00114 [uncultured bacterium]|nr:hypothetical protein BAC1_00114 [uncultured bacterium]